MSVELRPLLIGFALGILSVAALGACVELLVALAKLLGVATAC